MRLIMKSVAASAAGLFLATAALAQTGSVPLHSPALHVLNAAEALAQDAGEYARAHGVPLAQAMQRLRAQEESVAETDRIAAAFADRLAGISIEHDPIYRIVVLLTGEAAVPERTIRAGGMDVPVLFRTGAEATRAEIVAAIETHRDAIRKALPGAAGMGVDPRTGTLVLMVRARDANLYGEDHIRSRVAAETGVPVQVRVLDRADENASIGGGARVSGVAEDGKRYACTTGFVVTDGARTGVMTAAHCPDRLAYYDVGGAEAVPLGFVGQWGWSYRDVQIHVGAGTEQPLFFADSGKKMLRTVTSWRNRASTRAGDVVCRRGEATGYSCSQVDLVDYAPPGDLCGGPCAPTWVTVKGPYCKSGDSGGPIFNGTIAFGITKGGNYNRDGSCNFYFYMSTDYLPDGWSLLYQPFRPSPASLAM